MKKLSPFGNKEEEVIINELAGEQYIHGTSLTDVKTSQDHTFIDNVGLFEQQSGLNTMNNTVTGSLGKTESQ